MKSSGSKSWVGKKEEKKRIGIREEGCGLGGMGMRMGIMGMWMRRDGRDWRDWRDWDRLGQELDQKKRMNNYLGRQELDLSGLSVAGLRVCGLAGWQV